MKKANHAIYVLFSIILLPISVCSFAQVVDISGCRALEDQEQRFDCYEALGTAVTVPAQREAPTQTTPVQPTVVDSRPAVAQPSVKEQPAPAANPGVAVDDEIDKFGTSAAADNAELVEGKGGKTEFIDTVASVEQRLPTLALITLKSGQKWMQTNNKLYHLKAGDEVKIYPSRFGKAYRLTAPRISGFIQVERLQ